MLHDIFRLPGFTGEDNWTSSLRTRAGFSDFGRREISDFTYLDTEGALTRQFLQMQHHYQVPDWLATCCDDGKMPLYRIEVKSTNSRDATTPFYMSGNQYKLVCYIKLHMACTIGLNLNRQKSCVLPRQRHQKSMSSCES